MNANTPSVNIHDDDQLYRRLHHSQVYEDGSVKRIAYMLKGKPDGEVSADLARLTTPEESARRGKPGTGVGELLASVPRSLGFKVEYRPLEDNQAHCQIEGHNTRELCLKLAEATKVLISPQDILSSQG